MKEEKGLINDLPKWLFKFIRLLTAYGISVDESSLTGETEPVSKHCQPIVAAGQMGPSQMKNIGKLHSR